MIPGRVLAGAAAVLGVAAVFAGSPYVAPRITATELAGWIRDRTPGLHVIDARATAEFKAYQIPTAENLPPDAIARARFSATDTLVVYAEDEAAARRAFALLRTLGVEHLFVLKRGLQGWIDEVMSPEHSTELTRYFGGVVRPAGSAAERAARVVRRGC